MLASPQTLTINAIAIDCNRITDDGLMSVYKSADATLEFKVSHQETSQRTRRMVRIDQTKVAADPLTATNAYQKAGVYIVIDEPLFGFSDDELSYLVDSLKGWLTAGNISAVLASRH